MAVLLFGVAGVRVNGRDPYFADGSFSRAAFYGQTIIPGKVKVDPVIDIFIADASKSFGDRRLVVHIEPFSLIPNFQNDILFIPAAADIDFHDGSVVKGTMQHGVFGQGLKDQLQTPLLPEFLLHPDLQPNSRKTVPEYHN